MNKVCGIYEIVNKVNEKRYIGQSVDVYKRWRGHKNKLNSNSHRNSYLQLNKTLYLHCLIQGLYMSCCNMYLRMLHFQDLYTDRK